MTAREFLQRVGPELRRRPYLIGFAVVLAGLAVWAVIPFPKRTIKHVIVRTTKIFNDRDIERIKPLLADGFSSPEIGNRAETLKELSAIFDELETLRIKIKRLRIQVKNDIATADVEFTITWSMKRGILAKTQMRGMPGREPSLSNPIERCRVRLARSAEGYWQFTEVELMEPLPIGTKERDPL